MGTIDIDSLNEHQSQTLATFQSLTNAEDINQSIQILINHNWNLEASTNAFIAQSQSSSSSSSSNNNNNNNNNVIHLNNNQGWMRYLSNSIGLNTVWRLLGYRANNNNNNNNNNHHNNTNTHPDLEANARFLHDFEGQYGNIHPRFLNLSYANAVDRAKKEFKFLVVYLHSDLHYNTHPFCINTLCTNTVSDFINDNFFFWAASIQMSQGFQVNQILGGTSYPFLAVLLCGSTPGIPHSGPVTILEKIEGGTLTEEELIQRLATVLETWGQALINARLDKEERETARKIREEQDMAYEESLRADQEKERKAQEELERIRLEEEKLKFEENERIRKEEERKREQEEKAKRVADEPDATETDVTKFIIRLLDGSKIQRRFRGLDTLQKVFDYIDTKQTTPMSSCQLSTNYPKKIFTDPSLTLKSAGLTPQAMVFVSEK